MKQAIAYILVFMLLSGCTAKPPVTEVSDTPQPASQAESEQIAPPEEAEGTAPSSPDDELENTIKFTVPQDFLGEETTQESLDAEVAAADGVLSGTLNGDGSVTYVMTEAKHNELMQGMRERIDEGLNDLVGSEEYPSITAIDSSEDYTSFTVSVSTDTVGLQESFLVMAFYMYGGMYNTFDGTPTENITVTFVDPSGNIIQTANSADME